MTSENYRVAQGRSAPENPADHSDLKPIGASFHGRTIDTDRGFLKDIHLETACTVEIDATVAVMEVENWHC